MAALTMDQLLAAEALLHRASRTSLDYSLKPELLRAVDHAADLVLHAEDQDATDANTHRLEALLYPIAQRDDHCYAGTRMLCAALAAHAENLGHSRAHFGMGARDLGTALDRRFQLFHHVLFSHTHDDFRERGWPVLQRCTTGDRVVVLGLTAVMVHQAVNGDLVDLAAWVRSSAGES